MPEPTLDNIMKLLEKMDVNDKHIMFTPDVEKLKYLVGYLNTKGIFLATRISIILALADFRSLETVYRTLYGETYIATPTAVPDVIGISGLTFSETLIDKDEEDIDEHTELHENCNMDFISGSDMAAIEEAIKMFPDWSIATYKKIMDENKYTKIIKENLGNKPIWFVRWEPLIKDFPEEKQKWLKEFDKAIVY